MKWDYMPLKNISGFPRYKSGIWAAMGIQAIRSTGFSISFTYLPLYMYQQRHVSMTLVGAIILISGIIAGLCQIVGGMLADRFGHRRMFIIFQVVDTLVFAIMAVLIGVSAPVWLIFSSSVLVTIMGGMSAPAISAIVTDVSQKNQLTESYGLMAIGGNLGWAIGPLTGGFLQSHTSYAWVWNWSISYCIFSDWITLSSPWFNRKNQRVIIKKVPESRLIRLNTYRFLRNVSVVLPGDSTMGQYSLSVHRGPDRILDWTIWIIDVN